jgi:hypothetical protein
MRSCSKWFKFSFDPAKNLKGLVCKKASPQKVINHPFSALHITAEDFWNEHFYSSPGKSPLRDLKDNLGRSWHSDSKFKRLDGRRCTVLKLEWPLQKPI